MANSATPLATLPSKKRQSHDDGRNTPVHLGYPADHPRLVAGHQRNLRSRIRERAIPTLRQRPGIGRQSSGDSLLLRLIQMV